MVYEATRVLDLPCEIIQYTDSAQTIPEITRCLLEVCMANYTNCRPELSSPTIILLKTYPAMANALTTRYRKVDRVGKEHHPTIPRI